MAVIMKPSTIWYSMMDCSWEDEKPFTVSSPRRAKAWSVGTNTVYGPAL